MVLSPHRLRRQPQQAAPDPVPLSGSAPRRCLTAVRGPQTPDVGDTHSKTFGLLQRRASSCVLSRCGTSPGTSRVLARCRNRPADVAITSRPMGAAAADAKVEVTLVPLLDLPDQTKHRWGGASHWHAVPAASWQSWLGRVARHVGGIDQGRLTRGSSPRKSCGKLETNTQSRRHRAFGLDRQSCALRCRVLRGSWWTSMARTITAGVLAFGIREAAMPLLVLVSTAKLPDVRRPARWRTVFAACSVFALTGLALLMGPARPRKQSLPVGVRSGPAAPATAGPPRNARDDVASLGLGFLGGAALLFINLVVFNAFASLSFVDAGASADTAAALVAASRGKRAHADRLRSRGNPPGSGRSQDHRGHGRGGGCRLCGDGHGQHGADVHRKHSGGVRGRLGVDAAAFCT